MITPAQAQALRARWERFEAWRGTRTSYRVEDIPPEVLPDRLTNEEISSLEVFDFANSKPLVYFFYVREGNYNGVPHQGTTWTGESLGMLSLGKPFRDNFGETHVPCTLHGINGCTYHGTYFKSAGGYARVRLCAADRRKLKAEGKP